MSVLSVRSVNPLSGAGLAFGVKGHRLHAGPRRRLCCLLCLRALCSFGQRQPPVILDLAEFRLQGTACLTALAALLSGFDNILWWQESLFWISCCISASYSSKQSLFFLDENPTTSAVVFCNASFWSFNIFSGSISMASMEASLLSSCFETPPSAEDLECLDWLLLFTCTTGLMVYLTVARTSLRSM